MARWKITPDWKKSVVEKQFWIKPGVPGYIEHEIGWRWGEFIIETEGDELPEGVTEDGNFDIFSCGADCDDWSTDDGCWEETEFDLADEEEQAKIEEFLEENSIYDLEELGWTLDETEMWLQCEVTIEKLTDSD